MGKPPAAIFIVRHGARLDAANKDWHLTSPTPYDPPLSYGGWLQSRSLGARIINEVRSLEDQLDSQSQGSQNSKTNPHHLRQRNKKRRIIIHTSPFLRCVQTAIAISSGINQNHLDVESLHQSRASAPTYSNGTNNPSDITSPVSKTPESNPRCLLRVDACFGEWLNPEYFESIIPPPKSERMVANAKTELLRRDDSVIPIADRQPTPLVGHFPGGWSRLDSTQEEDESKHGEPKPEAEPTVSTANDSTNGSGQRNRASSYDPYRATDSPWGRRTLTINTDLPALGTAYLPPIPSYAISPSNPIPDGYVTHAREACAVVDYQWDSMREPQNWGSGGEYGDEWSTMLTRFRNSIGNIISWYQGDDASTVPAHRRTRSQLQFLGQDEGDDSSLDTILIIVTHGAGCNALIGALSGEPALVNVATASLTFAVRRDCLAESSPNGEPAKNYDLPGKQAGPEDYRLLEVASTGHLRPGTSPATSLRSPTSIRFPTMSGFPSPSVPTYRHRSTISSGPILLRPSLKPGMSLQSLASPRSSSGLWNSLSGESREADDLVPNFGTPLSASSSISATDGPVTSPSASSDLAGQLPQRTLSQRGLWRSAPLNKERAAHSSRRWTVAERPL